MRRPVLIVVFALLLAGCGGEEIVSPTGPVEGDGVTTTGKTTTTAEKGDPVAGKSVYNGNGCGGCHAFTPAGSKRAIGPNLDETLKGKDAAYVEESIANPDAEIASGYQAGLMPKDYGSQLTPKQLADLVAFLQGT